jgi:hypothetical protein
MINDLIHTNRFFLIVQQPRKGRDHLKIAVKVVEGTSILNALSQYGSLNNKQEHDYLAPVCKEITLNKLDFY